MSASPDAVTAQTQTPIQRVQVVTPATPTPIERMKSFLTSNSDDDQSPQSKATSDDSASDGEADGSSLSPDKPVPKPEAKAEGEDQADAGADDVSEDAQSEERQFSNLTELLEAGGFDSDKGYDLTLPVKVDGKEGTATIRDLLKSYQLDSHHHSKLEGLNNDRKALDVERQTFQGERADKLLRLDAGVKTLERALLGEFQQVDWNKLASEDPSAYNSQFVSFQQRNLQLQDIARQIGEESQQQQRAQQEAYAANLAEERRLMMAKIPEWSNEATRAKEKAEIGAFLETVGISKAEFEAIDDHRYALVARDAWKWNSLQKGKPATLKKVTAAPKLLKPGTQQSKDASQAFFAQKERERFKQSGKAGDGIASLKRILSK
jgi:hypothetical protein